MFIFGRRRCLPRKWRNSDFESVANAPGLPAVASAKAGGRVPTVNDNGIRQRALFNFRQDPFHLVSAEGAQGLALYVTE